MVSALLLAAALLSAGGGGASQQQRLDEARAKWSQEGFANYRMTVARSCFCPREYTRTYLVRVYVGEPYRPPEYVRDLASVPRLFKVIQRAIDEDYDGLEVSYGPGGNPTRIDLDPMEEAVDEESTIVARKLRDERDLPAETADPRIQDGSALAALREARARWRRGGLRDYRYEYELLRFAAPDGPRTVVVRDGRPVGEGPAVPGLFALVRRHIREGAARLRVRYAPGGAPVLIASDRRAFVFDDEAKVTARGLRAL